MLWRLTTTLTVLTLLSACAETNTYGTDTFCAIPLPSVSLSDTDQTIIEVDNYNAKIDALCGRLQ